MAKQSQREKIEENVAGNPGFAQEKINLYFYPFSTVDTKIRILGYFREDISVPTLYAGSNICLGNFEAPTAHIRIPIGMQ